MNSYYNKKGKYLARAWGLMVCWLSHEKPEPHKPHPHYSKYAVYGPYLCPGFPEQDIYDTPKRKSIPYTKSSDRKNS